MEFQKAITKANQLMNQHGLIEKGWSFELDNAKRRFGCCKYGKKTISLSMYMLPHMVEKDVIDTILHEIAHALVGHGHGHDYVWRRKALEIGCNGERCGTNKVQDRSKLTYKWTGTCPNGHKSHKHKLTQRGKGSSCGKCCRVYNPNYKFTWEQNY